MGYIGNKAVFGRDTAIGILAARLLFSLLPVGIMMLVGVVGVCYWIYAEVALELKYQHHYGAAWKAEFEHYHGSLSHAHMQVAVASLCMVALVIILAWVCRVMLKNKKSGRAHDAA